MMQGILNGMGFTIGFFIIVLALFIIFKIVKRSEKYKSEDLLQPFKDYFDTLKAAEDYESFDLADKTLEELENGNTELVVKNFEIEVNNSLTVEEDKIEFIKDYTIKGLKL